MEEPMGNFRSRSLSCPGLRCDEYVDYRYISKYIGNYVGKVGT